LVLYRFDLVVEGGEGIGGCGDVAVEIDLCDIFWFNGFAWKEC
jgi:hypothetical protein